MTSDLQQRVVQCFAGVFEGVPESELANASSTTLPAWDSIAHVTLLSVVSEEFGFELELDDFERLTSFPLILEYVEKRTHG